MSVERLLPTDDARELIQLVRDIADKALDPIVDIHERAETYPDGVFGTWRCGPNEPAVSRGMGGGGQPYRSTCKSSRKSLRDGRRSRSQ